MWLFKHTQFRYIAVQESDTSAEVEQQKESKDKQQTKRPWYRILSILSICVLCAIIGFLWGRSIQDNGFIVTLKGSKQFSKCTNPPTRREWRSLSNFEKDEYIGAVRCLLAQPSKLMANRTLYDDFPYLHSQIGAYSHGAAAFLSWHRYLLHIYEKELKETCGYTGSLTYWDWSLDWENLANSPVFSNSTGFGGNGSPNAPKSVAYGHCVTDGPFSDLALPFFGSDDYLHCLSRGFNDGNVDGHLLGDEIQPAMIEEILRQPDFEGFFSRLEHGHSQIPNGIRGDFYSFTAPNDPLFFLHHSQVDRLWWMWQQRDLPVRISDYAGKARRGSEDRASLSDVLRMGGFASDIHVSDIMNTELDLLCYRY